MENNVEGHVRGIITSIAKIDVRNVTVRDDLIEKFGVDSMQRIEIVIAIEKAFGISVHDDETNTLRTIADFVSLIEKHKAVEK